MATSFAQAKTILLNNLGEDDSATDTFAGQCLDQAQRDVARECKWPDLYTRAFFTTVDDYSTGTVTVTNDSAAVTGSGTVFPTAVASSSYRFALSVGSQFYTVSARGGDTSITLAQNYVGSTASGQTYILYKSIYALASDVDRVEWMVLHDGTRAVHLFEQPSEQWVSDFGHFPLGLGVPDRFTPVERTAAGVVQVLLGPYAPNAVYRVEYGYRKTITEGSFVLGEALIDLVICRAQALLYERDHFQRSIAKNREYRDLLQREVERAGDADSTFTLGAGRLIGTSDYFHRLMDHGTVESS